MVVHGDGTVVACTVVVGVVAVIASRFVAVVLFVLRCCRHRCLRCVFVWWWWRDGGGAVVVVVCVVSSSVVAVVVVVVVAVVCVLLAGSTAD